MRALGVSLVLGSLLTLSRAAPLYPNNNNNNNLSRSSGLCEYERDQRPHLVGSFRPRCDAYGNFLPQQCWASSGYCWCVNTVTGEDVPDSSRPMGGGAHSDCGDEFSCPDRWDHFGHQCFVFIDSRKTWTEAEGYCLFEDANLATVHGPEENRFLQALTRGESHEFPVSWIGGYDAIHMNNWMWTDGSRFDYENWAVDYEPRRTQSCLKMNYGYQKKWINSHCNDTLPFICAKMMDPHLA